MASMRILGLARRLPATSACCLVLAVILGTAGPATARSELDKMLAGENYDREKLLDEFGEPEEGTVLAPEDAILNYEVSAIALVLPLDADGIVSEVANAFLEGFLHAAEADGTAFSFDTYRTDGRPESAVEAYRQAVRNGAGMVVGPMLRSAVERVSRIPAESTVPTILLQEPTVVRHAGQVGAAQVYAFPLGGEVEIMQFARAVGTAESAVVYVLVESSALGNRLERTFNGVWRRLRSAGAVAKVRSVTGKDALKQIHDEVKYDISLQEDKDKDKDKDADAPERELPDYVAVFAAGSAEFAAQVRANMPSAVPVHVLATSQGGLGQDGRNILALNGIRFFEMPYVISLRDGTAELVASEFAATLPQSLQRYVAGGIDTYHLASTFAQWGLADTWQHQGVTGLVTLPDGGGSFVREGRLLELNGGIYTDITPDPPVADEG